MVEFKVVLAQHGTVLNLSWLLNVFFYVGMQECF